MIPKPSRAHRQRAERRRRRGRKTREAREKASTSRRDGTCRFPLCGCRQRPSMSLERAHQVHKGMGGDKTPDGARSHASGLLLLCAWRHQRAPISRHAGTLRAEALTDQGMNGPIRWLISGRGIMRVALQAPLHPDDLPPSAPIKVEGNTDTSWYELAREIQPHERVPLLPWQRTVLLVLSDMRF